MMTLSKEQAKVVDELNSGLFVWTNEGSDLKAWIGNEKGERVRGLKIRTVEILADNENIILDEGDYPRHLFRYKLKK